MDHFSDISWPELSTVGHVKGRVATEADVTAGNAVFLLQSKEGSPNGTPLGIDIPQYAIHTDEQTGEQTAGVVIQAEEAAHGQKAVGFVAIGSHEHRAGLLHEFTLLGTNKP